MTEPLSLEAMSGLNPMGFLAALGVLDVIGRQLPNVEPTLAWSDGLRPVPLVTGVESIEALIGVILDDRDTWRSSVVLEGFDGWRPDDVKPEPDEIRPWFEAADRSQHPGDLPLIHSLISEGALANKGDAKPTHFHFTAGQQKFLVMCRQLRDELDDEHLREALVGPWTRRSPLPVLGWDNEQGERLHALSSKSPSSGKKTGVPGAEWLAFLGLRFFPVVTTTAGSLVTTGCAPEWKRGGSFAWPLWDEPLIDIEIGALIALDPGRTTPQERAERGITQVYRADIRRADQGGYGSFGPTLPIL